MIPIRYDGTNWVKADPVNVNKDWYDYEVRKWANIATVTDSTRENYKKKNIGSIVKMSDINAMFVWIPRFRYRIFNKDGSILPTSNSNLGEDKLIDVRLSTTKSPKLIGSENGQWLTHPAFTFNGQELDGFWIGKFETGYNQGIDESKYTKLGAEQKIIDGSKILIKPNINSWRGMISGNMTRTGKQLSIPNNSFGLLETTKGRVTKNMEWGALAYLTNSQYGKTGSPDYQGYEKQVMVNNNQNFLTGCGANNQKENFSSECNTYDTKLGQAASTTGNITGVYDTVGGAWDYVGAIMKDVDGSYIPRSGSLTKEELKQLVDSDELDSYSYNPDSRNRSQGKLGDATIETGPFTKHYGSWDTNDARFIRSNAPFFVRGGALADGSVYTSINAFVFWTGIVYDYVGFRLTLL